jgi:hypothetical protein
VTGPVTLLAMAVWISQFYDLSPMWKLKPPKRLKSPTDPVKSRSAEIGSVGKDPADIGPEEKGSAETSSAKRTQTEKV